MMVGDRAAAARDGLVDEDGVMIPWDARGLVIGHRADLIIVAWDSGGYSEVEDRDVVDVTRRAANRRAARR